MRSSIASAPSALTAPESFDATLTMYQSNDEIGRRSCTLRLGALAKLVMRAAGDQAKTARGNIQLCAGFEAGIEGATHTVGQQRLERAR